jgi:outer membrane protein TolC
VTKTLSIAVLLAAVSVARGARADDDLSADRPLISATPGGLSAGQVAQRAGQSSPQARAAEAALRAAQARVEQARALYLPRLTGTARYVRLSDFTPPTVGSGSLVGTLAPAGTPNPPSQSVGPLSFRNILDTYYLQAGLVVPLSDYVLRIGPNHAAAGHAVEAAQHDIRAVTERAAAEGKVAFFQWLRARGAVAVASQALADQRAHLADAQKLEAAGQASIADVLRARTAVAAAELQLVDARNLTAITEKQVRTALHGPPDEALAPGETLDGPVAPLGASLPDLFAEARAARHELHGLDASLAALRQQATAARAATYPAVSAFANGYYANPNPRYQPLTEKWVATWDAGLQVSWSPNDLPLARAAGDEVEARVAQLEAQRGALLDGIELEVQQAFQEAQRADLALQVGGEELRSAEEAHRVARAGFLVGRVSSTTLADVETELNRARLDVLGARSAARVARTRLDLALGRAVR